MTNLTHKEAQRKYMAMAKANRNCQVTRKMAVQLALLNRNHAK